jgi:hypothetical protein
MKRNVVEIYVHRRSQVQTCLSSNGHIAAFSKVNLLSSEAYSIDMQLMRNLAIDPKPGTHEMTQIGIMHIAC